MITLGASINLAENTNTRGRSDEQKLALSFRCDQIHNIQPESKITNGREPRSCLG